MEKGSSEVPDPGSAFARRCYTMYSQDCLSRIGHPDQLGDL